MTNAHPWLPNLDFWQKERAFKETTLERVFSVIPQKVVERAHFDKLPEKPLEPWKIEDLLVNLLSSRSSLSKTFAGGVVRPHYVHPVVETIVSRGEFLTAYTPYQPEINQGALQALYEFQSLMAELYGIEVVNAGMYDGGSALGEAAGLSFRVTRKRTLMVPSTMNQRLKNVVKTYVRAYGGRVIEYDPQESELVASIKEKAVNHDVAAIVGENPLGTGEIYDGFPQLKEAARELGALLIAFHDPLLASVVKPPGETGADIVVGEGQPLGLPMNLGGPLLGILGVRDEQRLIRNLPGRIIGATLDIRGKRSYAMILQTREQHIRREKATSNITTNTALNAIAASISVSLMGKWGIRTIALKTLENSNYLKTKLQSLESVTVLSKTTVFANVSYKINGDPSAPVHVFRKMYVEKGIVPFILDGASLLVSCATEVHSTNDIDHFVNTLENILGTG